MKTPAKAKLDPNDTEITPGEILAREFLEPLAITAETALAFSLYFGNSPPCWLNLQSHFVLEKATHNCLEKIKSKVMPLHAV